VFVAVDAELPFSYLSGNPRGISGLVCVISRQLFLYDYGVFVLRDGYVMPYDIVPVKMLGRVPGDAPSYFSTSNQT
jgi:hypothetical protein